MHEVRFEVTNGSQLTWETSVEFAGPTYEDVNGGSVFVGEDSTVPFLNDLAMNDVSIRSATNSYSTYDQFDPSERCIYTDGYSKYYPNT